MSCHCTCKCLATACVGPSWWWEAMKILLICAIWDPGAGLEVCWLAVGSDKALFGDRRPLPA